MKNPTLWRDGDKPAWLTRLETATGHSYRSRADDQSVCLAIDHSGSMANGTKMRQERDGARRFVETANGRQYAVGLIAFANSAEVLLTSQPLDKGLEAALERLVPDGSTDMAAAIELAARQLASRRGVRVIYLVTDGVPNDPEATLAAAANAKRQSIDIMAVGTDDADRGFLERLVTRQELAAKVACAEFARAVESMALLLPKP